jgi:hemerythrin-like domain-containing protein/mannose-6-phosphate isomerase-like protein (cupin superfamily)
MVNCCELLIAEHRRTEEILGRLSALLEDIFCTSAYNHQSWQSVRKLYGVLAQDLHQHFALEEKALFSVLSQYRTMMLMEVEHDDLLALQSAFAEQLAIMGASAHGAEALMHRFFTFKNRLQAHILEEEQGIFPLAEEVLEPEEKRKVMRLYTELLEEKQMGGLSLIRPQPGFSVSSTELFKPFSKPMNYQSLYEKEHTSLQHLRIKAGQKQAMHWAGQNQCLLVISGEVAFETPEAIHMLKPGDMVRLDSRLIFALSAVADTHLLVFKAWPHPHYTKSK